MDSESIQRIEARLERVEASLERVVQLLDQVQPNVAMAADIADDWVERKLGGDALEKRVAAMEGAVLRLTEPDTLNALVRIAEQAPKLERVAGLAATFDDNVAMATDIADEWVQDHVGGASMEQRAKQGLDTLLRLSDPEVMGSLTSLAEQVPRLENLLGLAATFDDNVAMAADIADEWIAENVGGDGVEERAKHGLHALVRLSDPKILDAVGRLAEQAPKLETLAALAAGFDDHVAMAADIADEWIAENVGGDGVEERAQHGLRSLVRLTDPRILSALGRLAEQTPKLERVVELAAAFDDHVAMAADIFDAFIADTVGGDGLEVRVRAVRGTAYQLSRPEVLDALTSLAELAPRLQRSARVAAELDEFVDASIRALEEEPKPVGAFGLLGALGDPEIQRALGRILNVTKQLGKAEGLLLPVAHAK